MKDKVWNTEEIFESAYDEFPKELVDVFLGKDIKLAAEWPKNTIMARAYKKESWLIEMTPALMKELVDEAFEDVLK